MPEVQDAVTVGGAYKESDDFVPRPTDVFGTLDTSATAGAADSRIETVTPIHEIAKAQDAITAAKALDPDDGSVDSSLVVLPQGLVVEESGAEAARERVTSTGKKASAEPVEIGGLSPFQKQAAEGSEKSSDKTEAEQESGSVSSGPDASRQTSDAPRTSEPTGDKSGPNTGDKSGAKSR